MPSPGFQALILCGPGVSFNTFTANPEDFPKALIPIANRPMVWYPLDWCYRMGITSKSCGFLAVYLLAVVLRYGVPGFDSSLGVASNKENKMVAKIVSA